MPLIVGGVAAGAGLLKAFTLDKAKEDRQRQLAAETIRYSPWTKMSPGAIQEADPFGSTLQFGTTGAMLGQGMEKQAGDQAFQTKFGNYLDRQGGGIPAGNAAMPMANWSDYAASRRMAQNPFG